MTRFLVVLALLLSAPGLAAQAPRGNVRVPTRPPFADSLPIAEHAAIPRSIADAEAEGARWVKRNEPTFQPADYGAADFSYAAPRTCVAVASGGPIRSGEFVIGGNIDAAYAGHEVKIWWEPMHPAQSFSLVVRGATIKGATDTVRYINTGWAIGGSPREGTLGPIFYASGFVFPSAGRWLLIATSGPDWGCFILTSG